MNGKDERKSQGALEYLITYGWAILIIVIIGGALFALGVFNPSTWSSTKRATGFSSVQINDWKVTSSGVTTVLANKFGDALTVTNLTVTLAGVTPECNTTVGISHGLPIDGTTTVATNNSACLGSLTTGKSYTATVNVYFTAGGLTHVDTGTLTGKVEA